MTQDEKIIVTHGGDNGEISSHNTSGNSYIFELTYEELSNHHVNTEHFLNSPKDEDSKICQLQDVFDLVNWNHELSKKICSNIEVKVPI